VIFYGCDQYTLTPPTYFQGVKTGVRTPTPRFTPVAAGMSLAAAAAMSRLYSRLCWSASCAGSLRSWNKDGSCL